MRTSSFLIACMLLLLSGSAFAQSRVIDGRVLDSAGNPVSNASVKEKGGNITTTDNQGRFRLSVKTGNTLIVSSIGYKSSDIDITGKSEINVTLASSATALNEVVVTALGIKREKRGLTYSSQQVSGDELLASKEPNLVNAMAGKVSGMQVTSSSGTAGASARIVIRGNTSALGNNEALFVIDGVPIDNSETSNIGGGAAGSGSNRAIDIDPSIIESINVLKGAAATSLYGASGARGVVLITTKNGGMDKKPVLNFSSDISFGKAILPDRQRTWAQGTGGVFFNGENQKTGQSWGPRMDTLKINGQPAVTYRPEDFLRTAVTTNNSISVNGGGSNSSYFLSYSYLDQEGLQPKNAFKRHSLFGKFTNRIGKNFTSTFQLEYSNSNQNRLPEGASNGPMFVILVQPVSWNPYPVLNADGTQRLYRFSRNAPLWTVDNMSNNSRVNRFIPVVTLNYTPLKWLTVTERAGADIYMEQDKYIENPSAAISLLGQVKDQNILFRQFNHDLIINATKQVGRFNLNLLFGNNVMSTYSQNTLLNGNGLVVANYYNQAAGSTLTSSESHSLQRKVGFYSQANIDYNRFLVLSLTGRYDGSSVLSKGNAYYPYGSVATSFIFSELLPASKAFSFGKVRLSYASVGNDNVGPYVLQTPYNRAVRATDAGAFDFPYNNQPGFLISDVLGNSNLKNERLNEYEAGVEARFLDNRISFEGSYFYRKTLDGLLPGIQISNATGYSGTTINSAELENKGIELLIGANPIRSKIFNWNLTFNFTRIRNKVLKLTEGTDQLGRLIVGSPYNIFYGSRYERNSEGALMIDASGLPVVASSPGIIGDVNPDWLAGLSNNIQYKQFELSFFMDMKQGGDVQNDVEAAGFFNGIAKVTENRDPMVIEGISVVDNKPNTKQVNAQTYWQSRQLESTIQDGTYIKLRTLSLGYNLKPSFMAKSPFKTASLVVTGRNLWIYSPHFTSGDPEVSSYGSANGNQGIYSFSTPTARSVNIALKLSF